MWLWFPTSVVEQFCQASGYLESIFFFFYQTLLHLDRDYLFLNDLIVVKQDTIIVKGKVDEQGIS